MERAGGPRRVGRPATARRASAAGVWAAARRREAVATRRSAPRAGRRRGEGCEGRGVGCGEGWGVGRAALRGSVGGEGRCGARRAARSAACRAGVAARHGDRRGKRRRCGGVDSNDREGASARPLF
jgi:hypothetical protein